MTHLLHLVEQELLTIPKKKLNHFNPCCWWDSIYFCKVCLFCLFTLKDVMLSVSAWFKQFWLYPWYHFCVTTLYTSARAIVFTWLYVCLNAITISNLNYLNIDCFIVFSFLMKQCLMQWYVFLKEYINKSQKCQMNK